MDIHNQIPVLVLHVLKADIPQDTSIVDEDIDSAIVLDGSLDDLVAVGDAVVVGYGLSTCGFDLVDDYICGLWELATLADWGFELAYLGRVSISLEGTSQVVDNNAGAP
jgi:hypothetical protein